MARGAWRKYAWGLGPPILVLALLVAGLAYALWSRVELGRQADVNSLREWLAEARVFRKALPELAREYARQPTPTRADELRQHLRALGDPTKRYQGLLPLFPAIYRIEVRFPGRALEPIFWDSGLPRQPSQVRVLEEPLDAPPTATVRLAYQLHAYSRQAMEEAEQQSILLWLSLLTLGGGAVAVLWVFFFLKRERERELGALLAQHQVEHAERLLLENELRRQEAERQKEEAERRLLEQRLLAHEAEQRALEMKSQLYAGIGIMAGSYAHNIKNLLVRPGDLIRRCLETDRLNSDQQHMLQEVQETIGAVNDRLQQILRTVRRDPTRMERARVDLNRLLAEVHEAWRELAASRWKMRLAIETSPRPAAVAGDPSHLVQALENLLFNARDATFEMRNHLRERARTDPGLDAEARRQALIAAAAWQGACTLRTHCDGGRVALEVADNGIGMTEEARRRCCDPHYSTKRGNALYEGHNTGMGLGLAFVAAVVENHGGKMTIHSQPLQGAVFRLDFPAA